MENKNIENLNIFKKRLFLEKENHCVHKLGLHIVLVTKYRHEVFIGRYEVEIKRILSHICIENEWAIIAIEVMTDHIHLFIQVKQTDSPCNIVKTLKSVSAISFFYGNPEIKKQYFWGSGLWSRGYFVSSVGDISQETVIRYIEAQKTSSNSSPR